MKKKILTIFALVMLFATTVYAQSIPTISPWKWLGGVISPVPASSTIKIPSLSSGGTSCVAASSDGTLLTTTCGVPETDPFSLHLDQTTPQHVINGAPLFDAGLRTDKIIGNTGHVVRVEGGIVTTSFTENPGSTSFALSNLPVNVGSVSGSEYDPRAIIYTPDYTYFGGVRFGYIDSPVFSSSVNGYYNSYGNTFYDNGSGALLDSGDNHQIGTIDYSTGYFDTTGFSSDYIDEFSYYYYAPLGNYAYYDGGDGYLYSSYDSVQIASIDYTTGAVSTSGFYSSTINDISYTVNSYNPSTPTSLIVTKDLEVGTTGTLGNTGQANAFISTTGDITGNNSNFLSGQFRNGNATGGFSNYQQTFGYGGTNLYRHSIRTRHNGGGDYDNAIDFMIWNPTATGGDSAALTTTPYLSIYPKQIALGTETTPDSTFALTVKNNVQNVASFINTGGANNFIKLSNSTTDGAGFFGIRGSQGFFQQADTTSAFRFEYFGGGLGDVTARKFITEGGTSAKFVKGDGTLDSSSYFVLPSLTSGSVLFSNGTTITQDNSKFFWDNTNKRLIIGGNSGLFQVDIVDPGSANGSAFRANDTGGWGVYLSGNQLNTNYGRNADANFWINYAGYNNGATRARSVLFGDGKNTSIFYVDGVNQRLGVGPGNITPTKTLDVLGQSFFYSGSSNSPIITKQFTTNGTTFQALDSSGVERFRMAGDSSNLHWYWTGVAAYLNAPSLTLNAQTSSISLNSISGIFPNSNISFNAQTYATVGTPLTTSANVVFNTWAWNGSNGSTIQSIWSTGGVQTDYANAFSDYRIVNNYTGSNLTPLKTSAEGLTTLTVNNGVVQGLIVQGAKTIPRATFSGTGLNDAYIYGTYSGTGQTYVVKITTAAATDKFDWSSDGGATWTSNVSITGNRQALGNGVQVQFKATTGHTVNDQWSSAATATQTADLTQWKNAAGTIVAKVDNTGLGTFSGINISGSVTNSLILKTASYTLTVNDYGVKFSASFPVTATLPTAVGVTGQEYFIKNIGLGVVTLNTTSSQTIDGNASGALTLVQWDSLKVVSDGSNWIRI